MTESLSTNHSIPLLEHLLNSSLKICDDTVCRNQYQLQSAVSFNIKIRQFGMMEVKMDFNAAVELQLSHV